MSLRQLAQAAQVPWSTLSAVERGARAGANLTIATGKRLACGLGVTLDRLAGMDADANAPAIVTALPLAPETPPAVPPAPAPPCAASPLGITYILGPLCARRHASLTTPGKTLYLVEGQTCRCLPCAIAELREAWPLEETPPAGLLPRLPWG
jgi:transcriptional regulator with XRE-family HTH domain